MLKVKFGSAWPGENKDNEIVSIPGLRGREPKEITLKNLSKIIHFRVVEIIEQVFLEIKNYGHDEQKKKLIAGIVITGGGAQLKHLKQLVEYITGMDTRIGYPNEHLAGDSDPETTSPMYATAVGLVLNSLEKNQKRVEEEEAAAVAEEQLQQEAEAQPEQVVEQPLEEPQQPINEELTEEDPEEEQEETYKKPKKHRKNIFEKWFDDFKDFLDNAE